MYCVQVLSTTEESISTKGAFDCVRLQKQVTTYMQRSLTSDKQNCEKQSNEAICSVLSQIEQKYQF